MTNTQMREKVEHSDGTMLDVVKIWKTIQGEGPFAGRPAVFIRLAGCNLDCLFCDTDYTSTRNKKTLPEILQEVMSLCGKKTTLVVISGGEPFRQNIFPLIRGLKSLSVRVQIETNGTLNPFDNQGIDEGVSLVSSTLSNVTIVCSPKAPRIRFPLNKIVAWKYVIEAGQVDPADGLPTSMLGNRKKVARPVGNLPSMVYLQPLDVNDPDLYQANVQAAVESSLKFGYMFNLQIHKLVGLE